MTRKVRTVQEAIRANRRRYRQRVRAKCRHLQQTLEKDALRIEQALITAAKRNCSQAILRKEDCPNVHVALLALHTKADEAEIESIVSDWVKSRPWHSEVQTSVAAHYGILIFRWR